MNNKTNVLFLRGLNDDGTVRIQKVIDNNHLLYRSEGSCSVFAHVNSEHFDKQLITLDANNQQDIQYADCTLVFNQISNADINQVALSKAEKLCSSLFDTNDKHSSRLHCINHPACIPNITRDSIYQGLKDISGVTVPVCIRYRPASASQLKTDIAKLNLNYPVLIRQHGDYKKTIKLISEADIDRLSSSFFDNECYLIQYIDYADRNKQYRKLRLVMVDGQLSIRQVSYSDQWNTSVNPRIYMKNNSWLYQHEKSLIESFDSVIKPRINDAISQIHQQIELDYYGIDCALDEDMNLLVFRISPNMNILSNETVVAGTGSVQITVIKNQLVKMICNRLEKH